MNDRPVIAVILTLIVESAHWLRIRWDFDEEASSRVWQLTCVLVGFAMVLIYLDGTPYSALPRLLTWLPVLLVPMQFVQSFGMQKSLPISTYSFLAKQRHKRNIRLGLMDSSVHFNFGNAYFVLTMIGASLGSKTSSYTFFLPGIIVLTGWILLSASRTRPLSLLVALLVAGGIAVAGQLGLQWLEDTYSSSGGGYSQGRFDPNNAQTMVGRPGEINQSPDIIWRIRTQGKDMPPRLLRTATYNTYRNGPWATSPILDTEFNDLDTRLFQEQPYYILAAETTEDAQLRAVASALPRYSLRGGAAEETPLPLPGDAVSVKDLDVDGIERNSFGTIRIFPKSSVVEITTLWKGDADAENSPILDDDLKTPMGEKRILKQTLTELGLDDETLKNLPESERPNLQQKLTILRSWFFKNFEYTRQLKINSPQNISFKARPTAVAQFLTTERKGHCEYFATAATLLLREAHIPARYSIGYAVFERDMKNNEFVIRGTHGHAWSRVWDEQNRRWIDFDVTPPGWTGVTTPPPTWTQRFNDSLKRIREDFFLWRNRPANRMAASLVMAVIGLGVAAFLFTRLWKSKRKLEAEKRAASYDGPVVFTPLNSIERQAEKKLGPRPLGTPFAQWLIGLETEINDPAVLHEAIRLHQRQRFDPAPPEVTHQARLSELSKQLKGMLKRP